MNALFREIIEAEILRVVSIKEYYVREVNRQAVCTDIFLDFNTRLNSASKEVLTHTSNIMVVTEVINNQKWVSDVSAMLSKSLEMITGEGGSVYGLLVKKALDELRCQYLYTSSGVLLGVIIQDENPDNIVAEFNKEVICIKYI